MRIQCRGKRAELFEKNLASGLMESCAILASSTRKPASEKHHCLISLSKQKRLSCRAEMQVKVNP